MSRPPSRRRRLSPRYLVAAVVAVALAAAAWVWWRGAAERGDESPWRTVQVERGDIRVAISATGVALLGGWV